MKIARLVVVFAALLVACKGKGASKGGDKAKLEGTWVFDTSKIKDVKMFKNVPPEQLPQLEEMLGGMSIEFKGDKVKAIVPGEADHSGTFKVKSQDGGKVVLEVTSDKDQKTQELTITIDGDNMTYMKSGDPEAMPFKRK